MKLKDFSPESQDQEARKAFFLERNIGTPEDPIFIYDSNQEIDPIDFGESGVLRVLKKKAFDGVAWLAVFPESIGLYWQKDADSQKINVAQAELIAEVETSPGIWQGQIFSFQDAEIQKIDSETIIDPETGEPIIVSIPPKYRAFKTEAVLGVNSAFGLEIQFQQGSTKQKFYIDIPGYNVRLKWRASVLQAAVSQPAIYDEYHRPIVAAKKGISYSVADYIDQGGTVDHVSQPAADPAWTEHQWTFEPSGKICDPVDGRTLLERFDDRAGLFVDPYLSVDEQSSYINVYCDGYILQFVKAASGDGFVTLMNLSLSDLLYFYTSYNDGSNNHLVGWDSNRVVTILEQTPERVVIRIKGIPDRTSGATNNYLTNCNWVECIFSVYSDRFTVDYSISFSSTPAFSYHEVLGATCTGTWTSPQLKYESGDVEYNASDDTNYPSSDYIALAANERNFMVLFLSSPDYTMRQLGTSSSPGGVIFETLTASAAGVETVKLLVLVDTSEREGSAQLYDATDRVALGNQFKDCMVDTFPEKGSPVKDLIIPQNLEPYIESGPDWLETFEASGYDNTWSQGELIGSGNALDEDATPHASAPASWGSKSLKATCYTTSTNGEANVQHRFTSVAKKNFIVKYDFIVDSYSGATNVYNAICSIQDTSFQNCISNILRWDGSNLKFLFRVYYDGSVHEYSETIVEDTVYSVEFGWSDLLKYWYWKLNGTLKNSATNITVARNAYAVRLGPHWAASPYFDGIIFFDNFQLIQMQMIGSDAAWHYEPDANDEIKITWDRTRIKPVLMIRDFPFQIGTVASPTDILLNHLKLDDNAASATLTAEVGPDGTWKNISDGSNRNTNTAGDSVQVIGRGRNLDTQDGVAFAELVYGSGTVHNNAYYKKGSAIVKFMPQFPWNESSNYQNVFNLYVSSTEYINILYVYAYDFLMRARWNNVATDIHSSSFASNFALQKPIELLIGWDSDKDFVYFAFHGKVVGFAYKTDAISSSEPTHFHLGCWNDRTENADHIYDEVKTFSECLLPFGAFHIGNGQGLLADISNPHSDLCFFWDAQSTAAKSGTNLASDKTGTLGSSNSGGTTSFPTSGGIVGGYFDNESEGDNNYCRFAIASQDIFSLSEGSAVVWFSYNTLSTWVSVFGWYYDTNNYFGLMTEDNYYLQINSKQGGNFAVSVLSVALIQGQIYCARVRWRNLGTTSGEVELILNGRSGGIEQHSAANAGIGSYLYFGHTGQAGMGGDVNIYRAFISSKWDTPEIWTAFGKPIHSPLMRIDGTVKQPGTGYQFVRSPDGSILITQAGDVIGA